MAETAIKERPILFSGEMIRALLAGRKTMTRRVVFKDDPDCHMPWWCSGTHWQDGDDLLRCPYAVGMRLWVRETWNIMQWVEDTWMGGRDLDDWSGPIPKTRPRWSYYLSYRADSDDYDEKWRPSIFMPRWASRITLEITAVKVERLNSITPEDALNEGIADYAASHNLTGYYTTAFSRLWDEINGKKYPWKSNPWVWVIAFKVLTSAPLSPPPEDAPFDDATLNTHA